MEFSPRYTARTNELMVEKLGTELLIFDQRTDVAHCLCGTAATVWRHCRSSATLEEVTAHVRQHEAGEDAESLTLRALGELEEKGLLETTRPAGLSRREAMGRMAKMGATVASVPLIVSAVVTTPAMATSPGGLGDGAPCTADDQCDGSMICTAGAQGGGTKFCSADASCTSSGQACTQPNASLCCSNICTGLVDTCV